MAHHKPERQKYRVNAARNF